MMPQCALPLEDECLKGKRNRDLEQSQRKKADASTDVAGEHSTVAQQTPYVSRIRCVIETYRTKRGVPKSTKHVGNPTFKIITATTRQGVLLNR